MAVLLVVLVTALCLWVLWPSHPVTGPATVPDARAGDGPPPPAHALRSPLRSAQQSTAFARWHSRPPPVAHPLTEDDLIAFGLALESSDDVLGELVGR